MKPKRMSKAERQAYQEAWRQRYGVSFQWALARAAAAASQIPYIPVGDISDIQNNYILGKDRSKPVPTVNDSRF